MGNGFHKMKEIFQLQHDTGNSKGLPLDEAIRQAVVPGMTVHISSGNDPNAALCEIIRQFWGTTPRFILISSGVTTPYVISLIQGQLIQKVITTNCSYTYPTPRPIKFLQEAQKKGELDIESWSLYSLEQRLMAGALGVGFLPTKSIVGTSLAEENAGLFTIIDNPFDKKEKTGVVKSLEPDISLIHGLAADKYGNTILVPQFFTSLWGARASKNGVIVTVEKLVSTEYIREHSHLVKIPGYFVRSVSVVPFGAHPQGCASEALGLDGGYGEDYEFTVDYQEASRETSGFHTWIKNWVLDCKTQDEYLDKLGIQKVASLKNRTNPNAWEQILESHPVSNNEPNSTEIMVIAAAKEIKNKVIENGFETILAGIGVAGLAAWVAYYLLQNEGYEVTLLTGTGLVGYAPRPGDPFLTSPSNVVTCKMLTDTIEVYGTFVGGAQNKCLSVLGAAQIDKHGNINTLRIDDLYFIGPGGAGDAINATESIVIAKQSKKRLLDKVPYISCPGNRVRELVTNFGVFEKPIDNNTFILTKYLDEPNPVTRETRINDIEADCGWKLDIADHIEIIATPTSEELAILRLLDPEGLFIGK
jgi:acyl CoA:acetate/3-ketoacid CoA transferase alpha subunit/acyl CoA:acetate/3-ketoacid CoA transferase beta subunit